MLRDNRAEYLRNKSRGIPRDGAALLHGITWCGECGHKMVVRYKGGSQYVCNHPRQQHDVPVCQCLRAAPIDAQVAAAFLEAVAPAEIDALSRARKAQLQADEALRHAEERQIQRLRYQATLAERQFNRVDPDNRLVAGELERRWEEALIELRRAEETLARRTNSAPAPSVGIDPRLRAKVVTLGQRLPALWANSTTRREHRKRPRARLSASDLDSKAEVLAPCRPRHVGTDTRFAKFDPELVILMPVLFRDYETRSVLDLRKVGAWRYSNHPTSEVWCCAFAVDEGPVKLWKPGEPIPAEFIEAAQNPTWIVSAFNDQFERLIEQHILAPRYDWPLVPLAQHRCLQATALAQALPASLAGAAAALGPA